jgi:hypothetical protein
MFIIPKHSLQGIDMEILHSAIHKNPFRSAPAPQYIASAMAKEEGETLWGFRARPLDPPKLLTAWLYTFDPLFNIAGSSYRATEVRDKAFALQEEAMKTIRGHRKLSKVKMGEAFGAAAPNEDQTKIIAAVLLATKNIQVVIYDSEKKTAWTSPEDLRTWSNTRQTLWVDKGYRQNIDATASHLSGWISERESEGWSFDWPLADGTLEEVRAKLGHEFPHLVVHPAEPGKKVKKEDYCRTLGRAQAIRAIVS